MQTEVPAGWADLSLRGQGLGAERHHLNSVAVTWSELPPPTAIDGAPEARARVELGGQRRLRMRGYAAITDAAFQLRRRADVSNGCPGLR